MIDAKKLGKSPPSEIEIYKDFMLCIKKNYSHRLRALVELALSNFDINSPIPREIRGDSDNFTLLHFAASFKHPLCLVELLKHPTIDVTVRDVNENTPLHIATQHDFLCNVARLIDHQNKRNAQVENKDKIPFYPYNAFNETPLHFAAKNPERFSVLKALLVVDRQFEHYINDDGITPLHAAACEGNFLAVKLILEYTKTWLNLKDRTHKTPYQYALIFKYDKIAIYLSHFKEFDINKNNDDLMLLELDSHINSFETLDTMTRLLRNSFLAQPSVSSDKELTEHIYRFSTASEAGILSQFFSKTNKPLLDEDDVFYSAESESDTDEINLNLTTLSIKQ